MTSAAQAALRIGGVPEHFNVPWHLALDSGREDLPPLPRVVEWQDMPGGTGQMCRALARGELDLAVLLTEGIVRHIHDGGEARIVGTYTQSPLVWGIHVASASRFEQVESLRGARYAISRQGSGSQLMAELDAAQRGWPAPPLVVVGDLDGGRAALREDRADAFMWEKTMSLPLVHAGEWRRVGEFAGPWPAFVIAAAGHLLESPMPWLEPLLERVYQACRLAEAEQASTLAFIEARYEIPTDDILRWLEETSWSCRPRVSASMLTHVVEILHDAGILERRLEPAQLVAAEETLEA